MYLMQPVNYYFASADDSNHLEIITYLLPLGKTNLCQLGLVLGLTWRKVNTLKNSDTFLNELVNAWLLKEDNVEDRGVPTWRNLVAALKHVTMGMTGLAREICHDKCL